MKFKHMTSISVIALCAVTSLTGVQAQTADTVATSVESITVTARQRSESVQDVPVSIQAVTADDLANRDIKSLDELYRLAPTLTVLERSGGGQASVALRGIGTVSFSAGVDPSVATVIDGVVMGTSSGGMFSKFTDIDRVEVLKGPQGTLFGKNASAGVIQVVTKDPTKDFEGHIGAEQGSYDEAMLDGSLSGAIVGDKLLGRISFYADDRNGYIYNVNDGRMLGSDFQVGVRGKLLYELSDNTKIKLSGTFLQREQHGGTVQVAAQLNAYSYPYETQYLSGIASPTNNKADGIGDAPFREQTQNLSLEVDHQMGGYTLTSITAWQNWKWKDSTPLTYQSTPVTPPTNPLNDLRSGVHQYSQELRIASPEDRRVTFVAGGFLFSQRNRYDLDQSGNGQNIGLIYNQAAVGGYAAGVTQMAYALVPTMYQPLIQPYLPAITSALTSDFTRDLLNKPILFYNSEQSYTDTLNYAGFGEADVHITDTLTFIAGGRVTHEEKKFHMVSLAPPTAYTVNLTNTKAFFNSSYLLASVASQLPSAIPISQVGVLASSTPGTVNAKALATNFSWRLGMRWEPTSNLNFYGTVSTGFKGPGFNSNTGDGSAQAVRPETTTAYELGAKTRFWDDRISANLALFRTDLKNFQTEQAEVVYQNGIPASGSFLLENAGGMRTQGVELEMQAVPSDGLMLDGNLAYTDARYTSFTNAQCYTNQTVAAGCIAPTNVTAGVPHVAGYQNLTGTFLPLVPEWAFNLGAQYTFPIGSGAFYGTARADYNWRSKVQWDYSNAPNTTENGYGLLGLSFGLENKEKHYQLVGYIKNVTNQYHTAGISGGNATVYNTLLPDYQRTYGIRLEYNF